MSVKIVIVLCSVLGLGAIVVHGLQCYDNNKNTVNCDAGSARQTVFAMESAYNVSSQYTQNSYTCISLNQSFTNGEKLFVRGCTFANTTCSSKLKQNYVLRSNTCKTCNSNLCNGAGTSAINMSALIVTFILGVFGKSLLN
ncbi:hypothetical protein ACFFRR_004314 [Megaselia abdita]